MWQRLDQRQAEKWRANFTPQDNYQQCREMLEHGLRCDLESRLPELDGPTAAALARLWRQNMQHLLSGERLREAYTAVTRWPDRWQLVQHLVTDGTRER